LTSALLNVTYADHQNTGKDLSYQTTLLQIREQLKAKGYEQIPQLSSSRPMELKTNFDLVPPNMSGTRRAVMIGINYVGQEGELAGCHNDVLNMKEYIMNVHGFEEENIDILMDDGTHSSPTYVNIVRAFSRIVEASQSGDVVFTHYSGHGGKVKDQDGDEKDGYDETLIPLDYQSAGQIRDDMLFKELVGKLREGVFATSIMDCCHSGSVLDLPYVFVADGESDEMKVSEDFDFGPLLSLAQQMMQQNGVPPQMAALCMEKCTIM